MSASRRSHALAQLDESALALLISHDDCDAFTELYRRHSGPLFMLAYFYLKDHDAAADALQHVFMTLWENRARLEPERSLRSLLVTSMKNHVLNLLRNKRVHLKFTAESAAEPAATIPSPEEAFERAERERLLELAIADIRGETRREILRLRREGMSNKEVAEALGIPENTVKTYYAQSIRTLRDRFKTFMIIIFTLCSTLLQ